MRLDFGNSWDRGSDRDQRLSPLWLRYPAFLGAAFFPPSSHTKIGRRRTWEIFIYLNSLSGVPIFWFGAGRERRIHLLRWTHMVEPGKEGGSTSSPSILPIVFAFQLYFLACDTSELRREFWLSHGMDMSPSDTPALR